VTLALSALGSSGSARADEQTPISEGQPAPFDGILLSYGLAERLGAKVERCEALRGLEVEHERATCDLRVRGEIARREVREASVAAELEVMGRALADAETRAERRIWERPDLWAIGGALVGVVVGVAMSAGAVWAIGQLRPAIPDGA
jgi:hypothetical protein